MINEIPEYGQPRGLGKKTADEIKANDKTWTPIFGTNLERCECGKVRYKAGSVEKA